MKNIEVKAKLETAINSLLEDDFYLIQNNISERAITHKLAEHLQRTFPEYKVDCEYNKYEKIDKFIGIDRENLSKRLIKKYHEKLESLELDGLLSISTYPDIIVHIRGCNKHNLLIVEVKKFHGEPVELDELKLKAFTEHGINPYEYQLGVSVIIKTNKDRSETFEIEYPTLKCFENGEEIEL